MAQRSASAGAVPRLTMQSGYDDPKTQFDKRAANEIKKVKELLNAVDKAQKSLENERKAYCEDFKKHLVEYIKDQSLNPKTFITQIKGIVQRLEQLNEHYLTAIKHMTDVSMPALGYLTKRMEALKKPIKISK